MTDKKQVLIKGKKPFIEALELLSTKATTADGETYHFIPFWFRRRNKFNIEVLEVTDIPQEIVEYLQQQRMIIAKTKKDAKEI
jgi:hypothetical protein